MNRKFVRGFSSNKTNKKSSVVSFKANSSVRDSEHSDRIKASSSTRGSWTNSTSESSMSWVNRSRRAGASILLLSFPLRPFNASRYHMIEVYLRNTLGGWKILVRVDPDAELERYLFFATKLRLSHFRVPLSLCPLLRTTPPLLFFSSSLVTPSGDLFSFQSVPIKRSWR